MNLKKVKLVHETPDHFIMHDGKTHFHIAKHGLDEKMVGKIKGFAEGGKVKGTLEKFSDSVKEAISPSEPKQEETREQKYQKIREQNQRNFTNPGSSGPGGLYNKGGEVSGAPNQNSDPDMEKQALELNTTAEDRTLREFAKYASYYAEASPENQPVGESAQDLSVTVSPEQAAGQVQAVPKDAPVPTAQNTVAPEQQVSMAPKQATSVEQPEPVQQGPMDIAPAPTSLEEAEKLQMGGIRDVARMEAEAATKTAEALDAHNKATEVRQNMLDKKLAQIDKDNEELAQAAKKEVNPNRYWANQSTGSKISAALGLILGGAAMPLGQGNPAQQYIQKMIENDIEAQKSDQTNRMNLYKMGLEKYHDAQAAHTYAMLSANTLVENKLKQIAMSTQNPLIKRKAEIAMSEVFKAGLPLKADLSQRALMLQASGGNGTIANPMGLTEENRKLMVPVPGGGFTPALSEKDAEKIKQVNPIFEEVTNSIKEMIQDQEDMGRGILPYGEVKARAETKRNNILSMMSQLEGLNRLTDNELKLFKSMVPSSADIMQGASRGKMEELMKIVQNKQRLLYKTHTPGGSKLIPTIPTVAPKIK